LVVLAWVAALALPAAPQAFAAPGETGADTDDGERAAKRARARAVLAGEEDEDAAPIARTGFGLGSFGGSGLLGTAVMGAAFYFFFMRGRGARGGNQNWGSYYLFWIVAPAILAVASSHPALLLVAVVGLVARPWLPDPLLALRLAGRIRKLDVEVRANPGNVTSRRDLAAIWLLKRKPQRALPLLDEALQRDADSPDLLFLRGEAQLGLKQFEPALQSFLRIVHTKPTFRYGDAYLMAADALIPLARLEEAEEALVHYLKINSSSIEGLVKLARVRKARGDAAGVAKARAEIRDVWHTLHGFQRRKQLGWYMRARFGR
jgi:tetratricopeptide (TPR) repeat protein